jgi:hypothetical protein
MITIRFNSTPIGLWPLHIDRLLCGLASVPVLTCTTDPSLAIVSRDLTVNRTLPHLHLCEPHVLSLTLVCWIFDGKQSPCQKLLDSTCNGFKTLDEGCWRWNDPKRLHRCSKVE